MKVAHLQIDLFGDARMIVGNKMAQQHVLRMFASICSRAATKVIEFAKGSKSMKALVALTAMLIMTAHSDALATSWHTYHNSRFGTTADVPSDWRIQPPPANGDGRRFVSPDGTEKISIYGSFFGGGDATNESAIIYQKRGRNYLVYSGIKGHSIFYHKELATCGGYIWNSVWIEYPATQKARYDAMVTHVSNSLRGDSGIETSECK